MGEQVVWPTDASYRNMRPVLPQRRPSYLRGLLFEIQKEDTAVGDTELVPVAPAKETR
jgi:hypothetical protein